MFDFFKIINFLQHKSMNFCSKSDENGFHSVHFLKMSPTTKFLKSHVSGECKCSTVQFKSSRKGL